jgi:hypothetical protein
VTFVLGLVRGLGFVVALRPLVLAGWSLVSALAGFNSGGRTGPGDRDRCGAAHYARHRLLGTSGAGLSLCIARGRDGRCLLVGRVHLPRMMRVRQCPLQLRDINGERKIRNGSCPPNRTDQGRRRECPKGGQTRKPAGASINDGFGVCPTTDLHDCGSRTVGPATFTRDLCAHLAGRRGDSKTAKPTWPARGRYSGFLMPRWGNEGRRHAMRVLPEEFVCEHYASRHRAGVGLTPISGRLLPGHKPLV